MRAPKYAKRIDKSQPEIVEALRDIGCTVEIIGDPVDLLVGYRSHNFLIECKTPGVSYKGTQKQKDFIKDWRGQVRVLHTAEEAIRLVTNAYRQPNLRRANGESSTE